MLLILVFNFDSVREVVGSCTWNVILLAQETLLIETERVMVSTLLRDILYLCLV